jgi:hypothetical protein
VVNASLNLGSLYIEYPFGFGSEMLLDFSEKFFSLSRVMTSNRLIREPTHRKQLRSKIKQPAPKQRIPLQDCRNLRSRF